MLRCGEVSIQRHKKVMMDARAFDPRWHAHFGIGKGRRDRLSHSSRDAPRSRIWLPFILFVIRGTMFIIRPIPNGRLPVDPMRSRRLGRPELYAVKVHVQFLGGRGSLLPGSHSVSPIRRRSG